MRFVDTDVVIDILHGHPPAVEWLRTLGNEDLCISGFVVIELIEGCVTLDDLRSLQRRLAAFAIDWPTQADCERALEAFTRHYLSHRLGAFDAFIGEHAVGRGVPLCTFNVRHYALLSNLRLAQPYVRNGH